MIKPFTITRLPEIRFGEGRFREVPSILSSFGQKALIITGMKSFLESPQKEQFLQELTDFGINANYVALSGEPSPAMVDEMVETYRETGVDVVLAIGGGSVIDAGKAIAGLLPFGNSVMDHLEGVGRGFPYSGPPAPFIAVPTTAGTGTEATKNAVLSKTGPEGFKKSFRHESLVPLIAVVDPEMAYTCPPDVTASAGLDALTQLLESYTSTNSNPFTDALALSGLAAIRDGLASAVEGDKAGRNRMSYAALISGITLAQAGLGVVHGFASPLGGYFPIPHSIACGATLVPAIKTNIKALRERDPESPALEKYAVAGRILSGFGDMLESDDGRDVLVSTLSAWVKEFNIPGLAKYGVDEEGVSKVVESYAAKTNPVELTKEELANILRESL